MKSLEILPLKGFGELAFGQTIDTTVQQLGTAEEIDEMDGEDGMNTVILHYWSLGMSIFFEGVERSVISCFETDNTDSVLFGQKIFEKDQKDILKIMKDNGFSNVEKEMEEGETRLTFEDGLIDFFFLKEELVAVSWGVLVNSRGEVEVI
jgi:hypothetical protein